MYDLLNYFKSKDYTEIQMAILCYEMGIHLRPKVKMQISDYIKYRHIQ